MQAFAQVYEVSAELLDQARFTQRMTQDLYRFYTGRQTARTNGLLWALAVAGACLVVLLTAMLLVVVGRNSSGM